MNRKIDDIKDPQIRALAWKYRKANTDSCHYEDTVFCGFSWRGTEEGGDYWYDINDGNEYITDQMREDHPDIFKNEEAMKTLNIKMPNGHEIDQEKSDLSTGTIVFKEIEKKLPSSWEEYCNVENDSNLCTARFCDNWELTRRKLLMLRKAYIGDWVADWDDETQIKYTIERNRNKLYKECHSICYQELSFPTAELRDLFWDNFQDLLKTYFKID